MTGTDMIETAQFRDGMALLGSAVTIVTTDGPEGRVGFTATAVCSVTDRPPTLLVCVNRESYVHRAFAANGVLCVNLLNAQQEALSGVFANRALDMEARFGRVAWDVLSTGSPAIVDALVSFDCRIADAHEVGTHSVFYGEVVGLRRKAQGHGLVYFDRAYHRLGQAAPAI